MKSGQLNRYVSSLLQTMRPNTRALIVAFAALMVTLVLTCARNRAQLNYSELMPILKQNNLNPVDDPQRSEVAKIEQADSNLYTPMAGTTIYLESPATFDSRDIRPRYWLRVEDYPTAEAAARRAAEYDAVGTYDRIERAYGKGSLYISKNSVRVWAIARGKRVYALTTDSSFLTYIELPKNLRKSIALLPET